MVYQGNSHEIPIKMDDLGVPLFQETPMWLCPVSGEKHPNPLHRWSNCPGGHFEGPMTW